MMRRQLQASPAELQISISDTERRTGMSLKRRRRNESASVFALSLTCCCCYLNRQASAFVVSPSSPLTSLDIRRIPFRVNAATTLDRMTDPRSPLEPTLISLDPNPMLNHYDNTKVVIGNIQSPSISFRSAPPLLDVNDEAIAASICQPPTIADTQARAPSTDATAPLSRTLQRWKRRLITREDWKHLHKITGSLFLLASFGLTGYALSDLIANGWTIPVNRHGKPFLALLCVLLGSSVAQSFSSISMAWQYRRGQPAVRNTFWCNALVAILGSVSALWSSPWYPAALNGRVSMLFYLIMDTIGLVGMADNLWRLKALIASRQTTHKLDAASVDRMSQWHYWKDVFTYLMPILVGAPFFVGIGWQFGIQQDRTFYLNLLQRPGHPHLAAGAVYGMVMVAMGASYSSLVVTLRDKKLISKATEGWSLTAILVCLMGSLYQALRDPGTVSMILGLS